MSIRASIFSAFITLAICILAVVLGSQAKAQTDGTLPPGSPIALASGGLTTCVLKTGGKVYCWGDNSYAQLGNGFGNYQIGKGIGNFWSDTAYPVLLDSSLMEGDITPLSGAIAITVGNQHACALLYDGRVMCWGSNAHGQLGDGLIGGAPGQAGALFVVGLGGPGSIAGLTSPRAVQNPLRQTIFATAISAGATHTCALLNTKQIVCWGDNSYGQAGQPNLQGVPQALAIPTLVSLNVPSMPYVDGTLATGVASGVFSTCILTNRWGGLPMCWGNDWMGALGRSETFQTEVPAELPNFSVPQLTDTDGGIVRIVSSPTAYDSCVLSGLGRAFCWGDNTNGQLANGTSGNISAQPIFSATGASVVAIGESNACAILSGRLQCWGANFYGQLGFEDPESLYSIIYGPTWVPIASGVVDVSIGTGFVCAILNYSSVECWGSNMHGALGRGYDSLGIRLIVPASSIPAPVKFAEW